MQGSNNSLQLLLCNYWKLRNTDQLWIKRGLQPLTDLPLQFKMLTFFLRITTFFNFALNPENILEKKKKYSSRIINDLFHSFFLFNAFSRMSINILLCVWHLIFDECSREEKVA